MRDGWQLTDLIQEAVKNVFGTAARLWPAVLLAVILGAGTAAFVAVETNTLRYEVNDLNDRGRGVITYTSADTNRPALISRASCENLAFLPGVQAAGLLLPAGRTTIAPLVRDAQIQRASTTLMPQLSQTDILVGTGLLDRPTPYLVVVSDQTLRAEPAAHQREGLNATTSITAPLRPDDTNGDRCIAILDPFVTFSDVETQHLAALTASGGPLMATETLRATSDPVRAFLQRPGRYLPLLLGLLGAVATAVIYRLRASEIAVYRLSGTSSTSMLTLTSLETLLVTGSSATAATITALVLRPHYLDPTTPILAGLTLSGTWALLTIATTADLSRRRPTDLAKDR